MIAAAALVLCLGACSLFDPEAEVTVLLPPPPAHWSTAFPRLRFLIVWPDDEGRLQTANAEPGQSQVAILCAKAGNTPVLAFPLITGQEDESELPVPLRPAGGLFPSSCADEGNGQLLSLSWQDGPIATVLQRLVAAGLDASRVNAGRLAEYFARQADRWDLDLDAIADKIAHGDFSAYDIDLLPRRSLCIDLEPGAWFLESPFRPALRTGDDGRLQLADVSLGMHALFSTQGDVVSFSVGAHDLVVTSGRDNRP